MFRRSKQKPIRSRSLLMAALIVVVSNICLVTVSAATLEDYQTRIGLAKKTVTELITIGQSRIDVGATGPAKVDLIRKTLPQSESLDWPGGSTETNNVWLHADLDSYSAEVNWPDRALILGRIYERLDAIGEKIAETQTAKAGEHSKDEDKRKLAEILRRVEYQKPEAIDDSLFQRMKRKLMEWLASLFPKLDLTPREPSAGAGTLATVLQVLLYVALAVGIGFLLFRFLPFLSGRFGKRVSGSKNERVILGERIADDRSSADLFADAERLAREGQLRLAIRKGYIALLCELSDRKFIGLARHKTNRDYLRDLRSRSELFENVSGLTGSYERHWYGSRESEERDWEEFRVLYQQTVRRV